MTLGGKHKCPLHLGGKISAPFGAEVPGINIFFSFPLKTLRFLNLENTGRKVQTKKVLCNVTPVN